MKTSNCSLMNESESVSGTTTRRGSWPASVSSSPAVRRENPPAPHVTRLQCPAVIRWDQPLHQLLRLKVNVLNNVKAIILK